MTVCSRVIAIPWAKDFRPHSESVKERAPSRQAPSRQERCRTVEKADEGNVGERTADDKAGVRVGVVSGVVEEDQ